MKKYFAKEIDFVIALFRKIITAYQTSEIVRVFSVFLLFFSLYSLIYFSVDRVVSLDDPFFHIRFAEIFQEQGMNAFRNFHWIYFSKISINQSYFIYYNFLFYIILIPFTYIKPLFIGLKLYGVIFNALAFTALYYFLAKVKVKHSFLWIIILFSIIDFNAIWRFFLARPYTLAPALLLLLLYLCSRKKYLGIFILCLFYFYWHTATFFFPIGVAVLYVAFESFYRRKPDWKILASSFGAISVGTLSSLFFAPGLFPYMRDIIFRVFWDTAVGGNKVNLAEGGELYPNNMIDFMRVNIPILTLLIMAFVFEIYQYIESKKQEWDFKEKFSENQIIKSVLFFLSAGFFLGTIISKRNGDFFVFFSAAYIAMSFDYFIGQISFSSNFIKRSLAIGVIITALYLFTGNSLFLNNQIASAAPFSTIEGTAGWLENNTKDKEIVFNASWNWFPTLFYYDTHNYYVAGIEPRFLYDYSPKMYWAWWNISNKGYVCFEEQCDNISSARDYAGKKEESKKKWYADEGNQAADMIKNMFHSQYIVTSKDLASFNDLMDNNPRFQKVYTDNAYNQFFIYKIVN